MDILVLSNSLIVNELFKLAISSDINAEFITTSNSAKNDFYDAIFVDETISNLDNEVEFLQHNINYNNLIAIASQEQQFTQNILKKPFLPQDIQNLLQSFKTSQPSQPSNILDLEEIERIKSIMQLDLEEENIKKQNPLVALEEKKSFKAKNKKAKEVLKKLCKMKKTELKELLKNAKLTIKVEFKDE